MENLGHLGDANDHDSLGLFQQRPSSGWGTPEQITNPEYSTMAFEKGLKQIDGWQDMPLTAGRADGAGVGLPGRLRPVGAAGRRPRRRQLEQLTHRAR